MAENDVIITVAPALVEAEIGIPFPSGPSTLARTRMRSKIPGSLRRDLGILVDQVHQRVAHRIERVAVHRRVGVVARFDGHSGQSPAVTVPSTETIAVAWLLP